MNTMIALAALAAAALCCVVCAAPAADEIKSLPLWDGPLPSKQYSGYLNISDTKHLHYYFVESENDPKNDPVVLWMNGGPGCSSLDGFIYEHGPFRLNDNATALMRFPQTWASVANMIYLEAPVGVGFSYSDNPDKDYKCDDNSTAQDNLKAMETFFSLFPEYADHDFYITGESYAGIYVPTLAEAIVLATKKGTYKGAPLKGIAVGNGCAGTEIGVCGGERDKYMTQYFLGTAFLNRTLKNAIESACNFNKSPLSAACLARIAEMHEGLGNIDIYNVYGTCISGSEQHKTGSGSNTYKAPLGQSVGGPDACIDSIRASAFFNRKDVQQAIHVKAPVEPFSVCGTPKGWSYKSTRPNLPRDTYPLLIENLKVVVYNGDWDACVPYTDNEAWTESMGYDVADAWHPWTYQVTEEGHTTSQVAGYATRYSKNDFTFITIRGGRHEVPESAPEKALEMLTRVVTGKKF